MILSVKNLMGIVVYAFLEKEKINNYSKKNKFYTSIRYSNLNDSIKVLVPKMEVYKYRQGLSISKEKLIIINNLFEKKMNEDIYTWCRRYRQVGISNRIAIEDFATEHNIDLDDDITYDALRKSVYRLMKRMKQDN